MDHILLLWHLGCSMSPVAVLLAVFSEPAARLAVRRSFSPEVIKAILRRENDLRLSEETLANFSCCSTPDGWLDVVDKLQRRIASEFGLSEQVGLDAMRLADKLLPDDPEVTEISLYRKYNRCRDGDLREGDHAPDVPLHLVADGKRTALHSLLNECTPLVVFVGSYT
jgi:hypothetical protein